MAINFDPNRGVDRSSDAQRLDADRNQGKQIEPRYGSEGDLTRLGSIYRDMVNTFMHEVRRNHFSADVEDRIRQRAIGALDTLSSQGNLHPNLHLVLFQDCAKPDGVGVGVAKGKATRAPVRTPEPNKSQLFVAPSAYDEDDFSLWGAHRPPFPVGQELDTSFHDHPSDQGEQGVAGVGGGSSTGFAGGQSGRQPSEQQEEEQVDEEPETLGKRVRRLFARILGE